MEQVTIELRVKLMAQEIISQHIANSKDVDEQIKIGIENALKNIDMAKLVQDEIENLIKASVNSAVGWNSPLKGEIQKLVNSIAEKYIETKLEPIRELLK